MAMMVSERTPWRLGSALNEGRSTMVSSGTKSGSSERSGRIDTPTHPRHALETDFVGATGAVAQPRFCHEDLHARAGRRRYSSQSIIIAPGRRLSAMPATYSGDRVPCQG